jgi:hypothetical protein
MKEACPSLRLTERKRIAKQLLSEWPSQVRIEDDAHFSSIHHVLESVGAMMIIEEEPNPRV